MEGKEEESPEAMEEEEIIFQDLNSLGDTLHDLDDRGLVLSLAAFAEDALGTLLKVFMLPTDTSNQLVDGFNAPLGNFSSRIKAAYSLGLITKEQFSDLEQLRKIRNYFAHSWQPISLADQRVSGHIRSMNYSPFLHSYPSTATDKLRTSGYALLLVLKAAADRIENDGGGVTHAGCEVFFGFPGEFREQLKNAIEDFYEICSAMQTASGEALAFYRQVLTRLHRRTEYLQGASTDADERCILQLQKEILGKIAEAH